MRKKTTVYLEEDLLKAAKVLAAREGKKEYEVFEEALRNHLGIETLERIWSRNAMSESEAFALAYHEVHEVRRKRVIRRR